MRTLMIPTREKRAVLNITEEVEAAAQTAAPDREAIVQLNVLHTTAALSTADLDPGGTKQDYLDVFEQLIPRLDFRHPHDPSHMPDHILSTLVGTSLSVPWDGQKLLLGTWQKVVLFEFDGPRERTVQMAIIPTGASA